MEGPRQSNPNIQKRLTKERAIAIAGGLCLSAALGVAIDRASEPEPEVIYKIPQGEEVKPAPAPSPTPFNE